MVEAQIGQQGIEASGDIKQGISIAALNSMESRFVLRARKEGLSNESIVNIAHDKLLHDFVTKKQISYRTAEKLLEMLPEKKIRDKAIAGAMDFGMNLNVIPDEDYKKLAMIDYGLAKELNQTFDLDIGKRNVNYLTIGLLVSASKNPETMRNIVSALDKYENKITLWCFEKIVQNLDAAKALPFSTMGEFGIKLGPLDLFGKSLEENIANLDKLKKAGKEEFELVKANLRSPTVYDIAEHISRYGDIISEYLKTGKIDLSDKKMPWDKCEFAISLLLGDVKSERIVELIQEAYEKNVKKNEIGSYILEKTGILSMSDERSRDTWSTLMSFGSYKVTQQICTHIEKILERNAKQFNTFMEEDDLVAAFKVLERTKEFDPSYADKLRRSITENMLLYGIPFNSITGMGSRESDYRGEAILVYKDPDKKFYYTDVSWLPEDERKRLVPTIAYRGESERVFFVIEDVGGKTRIVEQKGFTPNPNTIKNAEVNENSDDPYMSLSYSAARHEADYLPKLGVAKTEAIKLYQAEDSRGRHEEYGVLLRIWDTPSIPFLRLSMVDDKQAESIASFVGITKAQFYENVGMNFGNQLKIMHKNKEYNLMVMEEEKARQEGLFQSGMHSGNVGVFGDIVDTLPSSIDYLRRAKSDVTPAELAAVEINRIFESKEIFGTVKVGMWWDSEREERSDNLVRGFIKGYLGLDENGAKNMMPEIRKTLGHDGSWTKEGGELVAKRFYEINA